MEVVLRKYGNSTVVVLPPPVLKDLRLAAGQPMTLETTLDGTIMLARKHKYTLDELVAQCDRHAAEPAELRLWENAKPTGREVW